MQSTSGEWFCCYHYMPSYGLFNLSEFSSAASLMPIIANVVIAIPNYYWFYRKFYFLSVKFGKFSVCQLRGEILHCLGTHFIARTGAKYGDDHVCEWEMSLSVHSHLVNCTTEINFTTSTSASSHPSGTSLCKIFKFSLLSYSRYKFIL